MTKLKEHEAELPVVVMTAFGAVETAVTAMQKGAADYLLKPLNMDELLIVLDRALERTRLRRETSDLRSRLEERYSFEIDATEFDAPISLTVRTGENNATVRFQAR